MRTSLTYPLAIASVETKPDFGRLGLTFCPGKVQPHAATGAWRRDLSLDLDAIAAWGAAAVVTLMEPHELADLGVPMLGEAVTARHMHFVPMPIVDGSVPDRGFETAWQTVGEGLRARLRDGASILLHCKGGLGRTGMIAARLLVELGVGAEEAMRRVRAARPGAIENALQEAHVQAAGFVAEAQPSTDLAAAEDRAVGALVGLAVGDALGTTLEFQSRDDKAPRLHDMIGGGPFRLEPGTWTDDTAQALALADSLIGDADLDPRDLMQRFVSWWKQGTYSPTGRCFDIGIATRKSLARFKADGEPFAGSPDPAIAGNGSLMRVAPVAIRHWADPARRRDIAARQSRCTHASPETVDACVLYADLIADAIAGRPRAAVLGPRAFAGAPAIEAIAGGSWRDKPRAAIRGSGYVVHSLEASLWSLSRAGNFEEAVLTAVNLREDADTTGAVTGQLAGALFGLDAIPLPWRQRIAWGTRIEPAARQLFRAGVPA